MKSFFLKRSAWVWVAVLALAMTAGCGVQSDVDFARSVFSRLAKGLYSARPMIGWSSLKVLGEDIGASYRGVATDLKDDFERVYIDGFKRGFQSQGATLKMFTHWRSMKVPESPLRYVAADCPASGGVLIFIIKKERQGLLLTEIQGMMPAAAFAEGAQPAAPQKEAGPGL